MIIAWHPVADEPVIGTVAILFFGRTPRAGLGRWQGRDRWSPTGWWDVGGIASLPIREEPTHWTPFVAPALEEAAA